MEHIISLEPEIAIIVDICITYDGETVLRVTSLLEHTVAKLIKCRFLPKKFLPLKQILFI